MTHLTHLTQHDRRYTSTTLNGQGAPLWFDEYTQQFVAADPRNDGADDADEEDDAEAMDDQDAEDDAEAMDELDDEDIAGLDEGGQPYSYEALDDDGTPGHVVGDGQGRSFFIRHGPVNKKITRPRHPAHPGPMDAAMDVDDTTAEYDTSPSPVPSPAASAHAARVKRVHKPGGGAVETMATRDRDGAAIWLQETREQARRASRRDELDEGIILGESDRIARREYGMSFASLCVNNNEAAVAVAAAAQRNYEALLKGE